MLKKVVIGIVFIIIIILSFYALIIPSTAITLDEIKAGCLIPIPDTIYNNTYYNTSECNNISHFYKPGLPGGQQAAGGSAANEDLILNGTSHATKTDSVISLQPYGGRTQVGAPVPITDWVFGVHSAGGYSYIAVSEPESDENEGLFLYESMDSIGAFFQWRGSNDGAPYLQLGTRNLTGEVHFSSGLNQEAMRINNTYNVSIGNVPPTAQFDITRDMRIRSLGAGSVMADANGFLYVVSDESVKTNINPYTNGLSEIRKINPITYKFNSKSGLDTVNTYLGFSAQNVKDAIPEAVFSKPDTKYVEVLKFKGKDKMDDIYESVEVPVLNEKGKQTYTFSLNTNGIVAALVNAVKEQQAIIEDQQAQIDDLKVRMVALEAKIK